MKILGVQWNHFVGRQKSVFALNVSLDTHRKIVLVAQKDPLIDDPNSVYIEDEFPVSVDIYTVTGMLLDINRYNELPSGIYILKANYLDRSETFKWAK